MTVWKAMRKVCFTIPEELLVEIDHAATAVYLNRSEFIRTILRKTAEKRGWIGVEKLWNKNPLDERLIDILP